MTRMQLVELCSAYRLPCNGEQARVEVPPSGPQRRSKTLAEVLYVPTPLRLLLSKLFISGHYLFLVALSCPLPPSLAVSYPRAPSRAISRPRAVSLAVSLAVSCRLVPLHPFSHRRAPLSPPALPLGPLPPASFPTQSVRGTIGRPRKKMLSLNG
jgi:hypothetical protein